MPSIVNLRRKAAQNNFGKRLPLSSRRQALALCERLRGYLDESEVEDVYRAYQYAALAHRGQRRQSGEAYVQHPLAVTDSLVDLGFDGRTLIAALLHDVIEDTPTAKEDINEQFGADVARLVDGVSKIGQLQFDDREHAEAENLRKMLMAMSKDVRVIIIKLADRLHNMRTLGVMRASKRVRISRQTMDIYAPIANRLGLHEWSQELEDLAFSYIYPKRHKAIKDELKSREGNRKAIMRKLKKMVSDALSEHSLKAEVLGRRKSVFSIYKKMRAKRRSFNELYDIYGFRLIVSSVDECYRALGVMHSTFKPIPGRFSDYVAIPKVNGYQSLHTVVFGPFGESIEIQVRTAEMDRVAEDGVAAHWMYKSEQQTFENPQNYTRRWLKELLDPERHTGNPTDFIEHLKTDLYPDKVYVFTPEGDIMKLPRGSTALDFAFSVHTDIGRHCSGARINHQLASLPTVLRNGDHVEIITNSRVFPTATWLNYAVTGRARSAIRGYLKNQRREDALKLGKTLLHHALKTRWFGRKKVKPELRNKLLADLKLESWDALLISIGFGNRLAELVARQIDALGGAGREPAEMQPLVIKGAEGILLNYARCCRPIPGDAVLGIFTAGQGLTVHTAACPNSTELRKQPDKCLLVEWHDEIKKVFPVGLLVQGLNAKGVFAGVASAIADAGANIDHISIDERDAAIYSMHFIIEVKNRVQLAQVIKQVRKKKGVRKVTRE
ncbi:MAG: bifunctional (p)ppGpp synthetase/guanosine-3',5'-bis(diphosphate) 3'-pyrophosphohydrolase [Proteobacteria bacterium]|jgi:GTP diphosphokinase / guanosine-3',5'-bis(diphosphate) 3'-diphosphatase|nr:bifunctional (p)ppGpp synthetase/guanosine-3',5'-bis(diphosphate) 3'-pyrophosphohydrolase [Pseudomonadota bacterium]